MASDPTGLVAAGEYGATNSQSSSRAGAICTQGSWTTSIIFDTALDISIQIALGPLMGQLGIYSFVEASGERYVGKSVDIARRLTEHILSGKIPKNALVQVDIKLLTALGDAAGDALPVAEHLVIDGCGGAKSSGGSLANPINAIAKKHWEALKQVDTDIDLIKSLLWP